METFPLLMSQQTMKGCLSLWILLIREFSLIAELGSKVAWKLIAVCYYVKQDIWELLHLHLLYHGLLMEEWFQHPIVPIASQAPSVSPTLVPLMLECISVSSQIQMALERWSQVNQWDWIQVCEFCHCMCYSYFIFICTCTHKRHFCRTVWKTNQYPLSWKHLSCGDFSSSIREASHWSEM